jgi:hypothetical protein
MIISESVWWLLILRMYGEDFFNESVVENTVFHRMRESDYF